MPHQQEIPQLQMAYNDKKMLQDLLNKSDIPKADRFSV